MGKKRRLINSQKFSNKHGTHPVLGRNQDNTTTANTKVNISTPPVAVEVQAIKAETVTTTPAVSAETVAKVEDPTPNTTTNNVEASVTKTTKTTATKNVTKNTTKAPKTKKTY